MTNAARFALIPMLPVLLFATIAGAMDNPRVDDKAGFFSADAISKANEMIAQIKRDHGKDVFIETLPAIPDELRSQYQPEQRAQFFGKLADQRAAAAKVDGVIVLITREPAFIQARVGKNTAQQAFIQKDRDQLQQMLSSAFRNKQFDEGLLGGVQFVRDTLAQSSPRKSGASAAPVPAAANRSPGAEAPAPAAPPANGGRTTNPLGGMTSWICVGFAVLLAILVFRAMKARSAQYAPGAGRFGAPGDPNAQYGQQHPGGYAPQPRGGGFGSGLLGGLLGGAVGGYAYDRFMRRPGDPGAAGDPNAGGDASSSAGLGAPPADTSDFGSGGAGDFGDNSAGDFGDSGGGDFGGGDAGGGGDF